MKSLTRISLAAALVAFTACGAGETVETKIREKILGLYVTNLVAAVPAFRGTLFVHPDFANQDYSVDGGATWCRDYSTWAVEDIVDEFEYTFTRTYTVAICGDEIGGKFTDVHLHCESGRCLPNKINNEPTAGVIRFALPTYCTSARGQGLHCEYFDKADQDAIYHKRCTTTTAGASDAAQLLDTCPDVGNLHTTALHKANSGYKSFSKTN